jgi:hypothetical protein
MRNIEPNTGKAILTLAHVKLLDEARKQSRADDQDDLCRATIKVRGERQSG